MYHIEGTTPTGWVHAVLVYHGDGLGFTAYEDGTKIGADPNKTIVGLKPNGGGAVFIGQIDYHFASATVDEVKLYNRQLSQEEICDMY